LEEIEQLLGRFSQRRVAFLESFLRKGPRLATLFLSRPIELLQPRKMSHRARRLDRDPFDQPEDASADRFRQSRPRLNDLPKLVVIRGECSAFCSARWVGGLGVIA
jgi:hypothetical protein